MCSAISSNQESSQTTSKMSSSEEEEDPRQTVTCKHCSKSLMPDKLVAHIGRAKKCKEAYGDEFEVMKKASRAKSISKYNAANRDKIVAKQKAYNSANREKINANQETYNAINREQIKSKQRSYNEGHREQIRKKQKSYDEDHKEEIKQKKKLHYFENRVAILDGLREKKLLLDKNSTPSDRILRFRQEIIEGQNFTCLSCHRSLFKRSVQILTPKQESTLISKCGEPFYQSMVYPRRANVPEAILCHDCLKKITKKVTPKIHISNGLYLDPIPQLLKELPELEQHLIAKVQIFMKLKKLPSSRMSANDGRIINVLMEDEDIEKTITSLPRPLDQSGIVPVRLKRKMSLKSAYAEAFINPEKALQALVTLKELENPHYSSIPIDEDFFNKTDEKVSFSESFCSIGLF